MSVYVILDNIRSVHNVGSVFRTSDAFGVKKLFLVGTTPTPLDRFGQKRNDIAKVALGAEETVPWEFFEDMQTVVSQLKEDDIRIIAVEQHAASKNLGEETLGESTAFLFGNEVRGISEETIAECDEVVEIPMRGKKESLNVSVTTGIVLFEVTKD